MQKICILSGWRQRMLLPVFLYLQVPNTHNYGHHAFSTAVFQCPSNCALSVLREGWGWGWVTSTLPSSGLWPRCQFVSVVKGVILQHLAHFHPSVFEHPQLHKANLLLSRVARWSLWWNPDFKLFVGRNPVDAKKWPCILVMGRCDKKWISKKVFSKSLTRVKGKNKVGKGHGDAGVLLLKTVVRKQVSDRVTFDLPVYYANCA
jgi:hypothetical protein